LVPIYEQTLSDFGYKFPYQTIPDMIVGMFHQLARVEKHKFPKKIPDKKIIE